MLGMWAVGHSSQNTTPTPQMVTYFPSGVVMLVFTSQHLIHAYHITQSQCFTKFSKQLKLLTNHLNRFPIPCLRSKKTITQKTPVHPNVHCSTVYNSQTRKQSKCLSTEERIKKMYVYTKDKKTFSFHCHFGRFISLLVSPLSWIIIFFPSSRDYSFSHFLSFLIFLFALKHEKELSTYPSFTTFKTNISLFRWNMGISCQGNVRPRWGQMSTGSVSTKPPVGRNTLPQSWAQTLTWSPNRNEKLGVRVRVDTGRTSQAGQWLGLRAFNVGLQFNPWWGRQDPTCLRAQKTKHKAKYLNKFNKDFLKNGPH